MNMKKTTFAILALALLMSACVKPDPEQEPKRFSILGDSYSTYAGFVHPETNDLYHYENIGLTGPEQMWWAQVIESTGWTLERNNSFSGSLMCNYDYVNYYGPHSFIRRMDNLGNPEVIFIFGATNDACANHEGEPLVALGDYVYSDWTEEQLNDFRPALAYIFDYLKAHYPNAKLYFLLDMNLGTGGVTEHRRNEFLTSIHHIAYHYGVECIDLIGIHKQQWHPDVKGHQDIAEQVIDYLASGSH